MIDVLTPVLALDPLYLGDVGLAVPRWGLRPQTPSAPGSLALARSLGSGVVW